jgi:hypothetical protein
MEEEKQANSDKLDCLDRNRTIAMDPTDVEV